MWYEDRGAPSSNYQVATSRTAEGPFTTIAGGSGPVPGKGRIGDYSIFVDGDGAAYHVRPGFDIVRLNDEYTAAASHVASFSTPKSSEGPTMFKRDSTYYITAGTGCCACIGGSSVYVLSAPAPAGPWSYQGDVGSNPAPFDAHSPHNFVTRAQGSSVFVAGGEHVYLGNQWNSGLASTPPGPRNHDLLYFGVLRFAAADADAAAAPAIQQMVWHDNVTIAL
jgi:beta-xylosidase